MKFRNKILAATILATPILLALPSLARAAQPVNGVYVSLGIGANFMQEENVSITGGPFAASGNIGTNPGFVGALAVGWGFGNGIRAELEGNYRYNSFSTSGTGGNEQKMGGMVNVLYDFNQVVPWAVPYVGLGAGYVGVQEHGVNAFSNEGANSVNAHIGNSTKGSFAGQAILGAAFPITPELAITTEYRFFALGSDRNYSGTLSGTVNQKPFSLSGTSKWTNNYNHALMVGIRYTFGVAPAPVPVAAPAPAPAPARSYLVFFDWDKANLTDRSRQIIRDAADNSKKVSYTKIESNGYTDTSGTAKYNQALSVRRAQAVAAELVKDGVPKEAIVITGFGESNPLVPTAANVREAQNRRVEIIIR